MTWFSTIALSNSWYAELPRSERADLGSVVYMGKSMTGGNWPKSPNNRMEHPPKT